MLPQFFRGRVKRKKENGLGLGSCQIAALYDDEVNAVLGVDGKEESIVYMTALGRP